MLGALLTALSFSDWDSKSTSEKGGAVGSAAGGTIGAIAGSLFGPAGTVIGGLAGAWIGDKLGSTVAPYFKDWTDSLKAADLPGMLKSGWDSFMDIVTKAFNLTPAGQTTSLLTDIRVGAGIVWRGSQQLIIWNPENHHSKKRPF